MVLVLVLGSTLFAMPASPASALDRQHAPHAASLAGQAPLQRVSLSATGDPLGIEIPIEISTPGQHASFTFEGSADEVVTVAMDGSTIHGCWTRISILAPDMTQLTSTQTCRVTADLEHIRLPANGTYTLMLIPAGASIGTARLTLYTVVDDVGSIQADGPPIALDLSTPGQLASYTFDGSAGQIVTAMLSNSTIHGCWTSLTILKPDQTRLDSVNTCGASALLAHRTLPADGTYTLTVNPAGVSTGRATLTLYTVVDVEESVPDVGTPVPSRRSPR
jgi:hypothetical protein